MASATQQLRQWLHAFDFRALLVEGLGWQTPLATSRNN